MEVAQGEVAQGERDETQSYLEQDQVEGGVIPSCYESGQMEGDEKQNCYEGAEA